MFVFRSLEFVDDPLFGSAVLDFGPGLTVVYGLNKTTERSRNGNAAGKSYLFSQIPEIIWETPVQGQRQDRQSEGTRILHVTYRKKKYRFERKGTKLNVYRGNSLLFKGATDTKNWVKSLPFTEQEFTGLYYLDSRRHHPLVMGTSAERSAYLTKFFDLDRIVHERKIIASELAELKSVRAAVTETQSSLDLLETHRPRLSPKKIKQRLASLLEQQQRYRAKQKQYDKWRRAQDIKKGMARPLAVVSDFIEAKDLRDEAFIEYTRQLTEQLAEDNKLLADAQAYRSWQERSRDYQEVLSKLSKTARAHIGDSKCRSSYSKYMKIKASMPDLGPKPKKPEPVNPVDPKKLRDLQIRVRDLEHEAEHAENFKTGKCPTCGSSVKARKLKTIVRELEIAQSKLEALESAADDYAEYEAAIREYKEKKKKWVADKQKREEAQAQLARHKERARAWTELRELPKKPKPFDGKKVDIRVVQSMVELTNQRLEAIRQLRPVRKFLGPIKKVRDYGTKLEELSSEIADLRSELQNARTYAEHRKQLRTRARELESQLADEPTLRLLADAYAEKGMKRLAIESVTSLLAQQLNKYAPLVLPNAKFSIEWDKSKLSILCHRPGLKTIDVRKLSGAEYRLFTCLLIFSQLQFVPQSKRSSLMVLDEPATNMHPETAEAFAELLKLLQTVIPSIVVITPQPDEVYDDARALTVVRANGISKIVEGHPNAIRN